MYTSFHWIAPQFHYRQSYFRQTSRLGAGYKAMEKELLREDRTIRYYFQTGEKANYAGMAADYRTDIMETYGLKQRQGASDPRLQLTIYGGAEEKGLFQPHFVTATTFDQAFAITESLHKAGVGKLDATLVGWSEGGEESRLPAVLPAEKKLGGWRG
ncbi:DUF5696 domain-containing protein [Paenibacillus sp. CC-CFT747]|nr:DUF5696 domain-containing protein [Paenibacillus sp. CC-CFT747]